MRDSSIVLEQEAKRFRTRAQRCSRFFLLCMTLCITSLTYQSGYAQCPIGNNTATCSGSTEVIDLNSLLTYIPHDGSWFWDGNGDEPDGFNDALGTFDPSSALPGAYTFGFHYYAHNGCNFDGTTYVIVNVMPGPVAGQGSHILTCDASGIDLNIDLNSLLFGEQPGGIWTASPSNPAGGTFNPLTATFNPDQGYGKYVFIYSVENGICDPESAKVYITVQDDPLQVGTASNINICSNSHANINLYNLLSDEDEGGLWTPLPTNPAGGEFSPTGTFDVSNASSTPPNNVYGFSYSFPSNCISGPNSALVYITINQQNDPGINNEISICAGAPIITLIDELGGSPDPNGTWSADPSIGFGIGTFDPSENGVIPGKYTFTYTFLPSQGCPTAEATLIINVINQPSVGNDGDLYICQGSITPVNLFDVISNENEGGIWTDLSSALEVSNPYALDVSGLAPGIYDYEYSTSVFPGCMNANTSIASLIVNGPQPEAGPGGAITSCNGIVDLTGGLTFIVSPGGVWIDNNNSGVDLSDPMNVDLASLTTGIYSYSYVFGANTGCHVDEATVTVLIPSDPPNVGDIAQLNVCENTSPNVIDLFSLLTGTDPGGEWTDELANVIPALFDVSALPTVAGSETFIFNYDFGVAQDCMAAGTSVEITVWEYRSAGEGSEITVCSGSDLLTLSDYISGYETGGFWTISGANSHLGTFNAVDGTFDITGALPGIYYFAYTQSNTSPCQPDQSIVTIHIVDDVVQLEAQQYIGICEGSTEIIDIREFVTGQGASNGGIFNLISGAPASAFDPITGIFNPVGVNALTSYVIEHNYANTCGVLPETITISVGSTLSAGTAQNLTVCKDYIDANTIDLWAQLSGFDLGGIWLDDSNTGLDLTNPAAVDISTLNPGTYAFTYKFFASGECDKNSTTVLINCINEPPYLGYGSNIGICEGDETLIDLTSLLTGSQLGGNWVDQNGAGVDLSHPAGVDFTSVLPGTYIFRYEFLPLGNCAEDSFVNVTVSVSDARDAGNDVYFTICGDLTLIAPFSVSTGGDLGGNWTNESSNPPGTVLINGDFIPANAFPGTYMFNYNFTPSGGCPGDNAMVTVHVLAGDPVANAAVNVNPICAYTEGNYNLNELLAVNTSPGGIWKVDPTTPLPPNTDLNVNSGDISTATLLPGLYLFDYEFENTICGSTNGVWGVELSVEPSAVGTDGIITICDHEDASVNLEAILGIISTPAGGNWTDVNGAGVNLNSPAAVDFSSIAHGTYSFELSVDDPMIACSPEAATATVIVSSQPDAGIGGKHEVCMFSSGDVVVDLNTLLEGQDPGGAWAGPQPEDGGSFDPATGILSITAATTIRTYNYTYSFNFSDESPCDNQTASIKIKVTTDCGNTTPCFATQRYNAGSAWNEDGTINDAATTGGIVKCGEEGTFMTLDAPTDSYDPNLFEIDLTGTSFYDPYNGYMMTPPHPQVGEDIIWVNFDVRPFVSAFELILQDDEHLAWALYESNVHTTGTSIFTPNESLEMELSGDCSSLRLVRSGLASEMWNTIMIDYSNFTKAHNYYLAIWDWSDNVNIGDGPNGGIVNAFGTRMGCETEDICIAPLITSEPSFMDHKNGTYSITIEVEGINGEYIAIDKTGAASYISEALCLTNSSSTNPTTTGSFTLTYPNTVGYEIQIAAIDPSLSMCDGAENYHYCVTDLLTPPKTPFAVICDGGYDAEHVYHSFDMIPDNTATDVSILTPCGGQDIHITYGDIIRQKGEYLYEVERVYTVFSGCQLPGKEDDQQATCSVYYTVDYSDYQPSNICDLACNLNGINVGINEECEALITPAMVLEGPNHDCTEDYYLVLTDPSDKNRKVPNPINKNYIGKTLQAQVYHINGNQVDNSCWGYVTIEDKLPPVIYCPKPDTISCNAIDPVINIAGWVHDACASFTIENLGETLEEFDCDPYAEFAAVKTIRYVAVDESGNRSLPCDYTLYYMKDTISVSDFPDDISISCSDLTMYDEDGDGLPDPSFTGAPSLGGRHISKTSGHCQIQASFEDQVIPLCDRSYKILRKWTVLDWCRPTSGVDNNPLFEYQIIKVEDKDGPEMYCTGEDLVYDSDPLECGMKKMKVTMPEIGFDCGSGDFRYVIGHKKATPGEDPYDKPDTTGVYFENGEYWIQQMPYGDSWVVCTVYDLCGNSSRCHYKVTVKDKVAPIPVCDENTVVTLSSDNSARVWAESFNDGSFDFCSEISLSVARRDGYECDGEEPSFKEYVDFCCADIGIDHMVVLKVEDVAGNHNSCMVRVQIVDKHIPKFHHYPDHQDIYCYQDIAQIDMGRPEVDEECGAYTIDYEDIGDYNQCKIGTIIRRWHLWDANGDEMDRYDQEIHVMLDRAFEMDPSNWPPNYNSEAECEISVTSPEVAGEPITDNQEGCTLIATTYEDEEFYADAEACLKILRKWTVVDWCQYDENVPSDQNPGLWKYTQKITINNTVSPVFSDICTDIIRNGSTGDCLYSVQLNANVTDDCTPADQLNIKYEITFEGGTTAAGTGLTYSSTAMPAGMHTIKWTAKDKCGNTAVCTETFLLEDDIAPTPYCLAEVSTVISPSTMDVDLWAVDFDLGSYDNCPNVQLDFKLKLSGTSDTLSSNIRFTCADVGNQNLEIWIFDSSGNSDFCHSVVDIQANSACPDDGGLQGQNGSMALISGRIQTVFAEPVDKVMVDLEHMTAKETYMQETNVTGHFSFDEMPMNDDYKITPSRNDDPLNGVSTLDMVLIQKHILGTIPFDSPYDIIAADINNSESLSAVDIVELRQVVLGNEDSFLNNNSWRFINKDQTFVDAFSPWPFVEEVNVYNLNIDNSTHDFVAVKVGDVNGSAKANTNAQIAEVRANTNLKLTTDDYSYSEGQVISVPIRVKEKIELSGLQFTMSFDAKEATPISIESELQGFDKNHYHIFEDGKFTFSWNENDVVTLQNDYVLFEIQFEVHSTGSNIDLNLDLNSNVTKAEAYTSELAVMDVDFDILPIQTAQVLELFQNRPNPFSNETVIEFYLGKASDHVQLSVFDVKGNAIFNQTGSYSKGVNQIKLSKTELPVNGILYYRIEVDNQVQTKSMLSVD